MSEYLSDDWFAEAGRRLAESRIEPWIEPPGWGIRVVVTEQSGDAVEYGIVFCGDTVSMTRRPEDLDAQPSVHFQIDEDTARQIAAGTISAQRAFMSGTLRVSGDVGLLIEHNAALDQLAPLLGASAARGEPLSGLGEQSNA